MIQIRFIEHSEQRYDTAGDYWLDEEEYLQIRVSKLPDYRMMVAIAIHELIEYFICRHQSIAEEVITAFDVEYERTRTILDTSEPGDSRDAPYHLAHGFATGAERLYAAAVGLNWEIYTDAVNALVWRVPGAV